MKQNRIKLNLFPILVLPEPNKNSQQLSFFRKHLHAVPAAAHSLWGKLAR